MARGYSRASKHRIRHAQRAQKAMELRLKGQRYSEIAKALGISEVHAWRLVTKQLDMLNQKRMETAERVQRLELERLDDLWASVYPKTRRGDLSAINTALSIMQRRAKLLGLDVSDKDGDQSNAAITLNIQEVVIEHKGKDNPATAIEDRRAASGAGRLSQV